MLVCVCNHCEGLLLLKRNYSFDSQIDKTAYVTHGALQGWLNGTNFNWMRLWRMARPVQIPCNKTENNNTPRPIDQIMDSPLMDPQVGKCKSFASTHYLANVFACAVAHRQAYIASLRWHNGSNIVPDSHPFHSKSNDPPIPKIWLFENFTMKIQIWWSLLEWVVSYRAGKLGVYAPTDTRTDRCKQWQYLKDKTGLG